MHGYQHRRMGVAAGVGIVAYSVLSDSSSAMALFMVTTPIGALLPDIDHDMSKMGKVRAKVVTGIKIGITAGIIAAGISSYLSGGIVNVILNVAFLLGIVFLIHIVEKNKFIKKQLGFITKHRGIMHTLVPPMFIFASTFWTNNQFYDYLIYGLCIGYIVHLIGDMANKEGIPLLWPIVKNSNIRYMSIVTNKSPMVLDIVCYVWCVVFILLGIVFGVKGGF